MQRIYLSWGALLAMLAVAVGAFGSHILKPIIGEQALGTFETGVHYHMFHALGLIAVGLLAGQRGDRVKLRWAGRLMMAGIVLFSGSLYVLSIWGIKALGAVTPLGGVCFLGAWLLLALEAKSGPEAGR